MMNDKRQFPRRRVNYPVRIVPDQSSPGFDGSLWDISRGGARLTVDAGCDVPPEFVLVLSANGSVQRRCQLVWRADRNVGVRFVEGEMLTAGSERVHTPVTATINLEC